MKIAFTTFFLFSTICLYSQQVIYSESFGNPATTTQISNFQFDNIWVRYSGSADIRTTSPSNYPGSSAQGNCFFKSSDSTFLLIEGIAIAGYNQLQLSLGHSKSATAVSNELKIEVSINNTPYQNLAYSRPSGAGTTGWIKLQLPIQEVGDSLKIRFKQSGATASFRIDDLKITGVPVNCSTPTEVLSCGGFPGLEQYRLFWEFPQCGDQVLVLGKLNSPPESTPQSNFNEAFSLRFGEGFQSLDKEFLIYQGTDTNIIISDLWNDSTYYISVYTYKNGLWSDSILSLAVPGLTKAGWGITQCDSIASITFDKEIPNVLKGTYLGLGLRSEPDSGFLDSDAWEIRGLSEGDALFGENHTGGDFGRGSSSVGVTTNGIWNFLHHPVYLNSLGVQGGASDMNPGEIILKIQNLTDQIWDEITLTYLLHINDNGGRSSKISFAYGVNSGSYVQLPELDIITPTSADITPGSGKKLQSSLISVRIPISSLIPNEFLYVRWRFEDQGGVGNRDEVGLDNVQIIANPREAIVLTMEDSIAHFISASNISLGGTVMIDSLFLLRDSLLVIGDLTCNNLSINEGSVFTIGEGQALHSREVNNDGHLLLKSGASLFPNGSLIYSGIGEQEIHRKKPENQPADFYNFWSSPISLWDKSMFPMGRDFYHWDPMEGESGSYVPVASFNIPAQGFISRGAAAAVFKGDLSNGTISFTSQFNEESDESWNLIGNPYPSPVSALDFVNENSHLLASGSIYLWSQNNSENFSVEDDYQVYNLVGSPDYQSDLDLSTLSIASCQSFFVETSRSSTGLFKNTMRKGENGFFKDSETKKFWLRLQDEAGRYSSTLIGLNPESTMGFDKMHDAKLISSGELGICSKMENQRLCIQSIPEEFVDTAIIPVECILSKVGIYSIDIPKNLIDNTWRIDLYTADSIFLMNLNKSVYYFEKRVLLDSSQNFLIKIYRDLAFTSIGEFTKKGFWKPFSGGLQFYNSDKIGYDLLIHTAEGKKIHSGKIGLGEEFIWIPPQKGFYLITKKSSHGKDYSKIFWN